MRRGSKVENVLKWVVAATVSIALLTGFTLALVWINEQDTCHKYGEASPECWEDRVDWWETTPDGRRVPCYDAGGCDFDYGKQPAPKASHDG